MQDAPDRPSGKRPSERAAGGERETGAVCLVYMTAPDAETADRLAETLVEERLAACVNILGPLHSVYRWDGRIEKDREIAMLAKTSASGVKRLVRRVVELHPYECPCVAALPVTDGHPAFLEWIGNTLHAKRGGR